MNRYQVLAILCKSVDDSHKLVSALQHRMTAAMTHFKSQYLWFNQSKFQKEQRAAKSKSLVLDARVKDGQSSGSWWKKKNRSLPRQPAVTVGKHEHISKSQEDGDIGKDLMIEYEDQTSFYRRPLTPLTARRSSRGSVGHKIDRESHVSHGTQYYLNSNNADSSQLRKSTGVRPTIEAPSTVELASSEVQRRQRKIDRKSILPDLPKNPVPLNYEDCSNMKVVMRQKKTTPKHSISKYKILILLVM